MPACFTLWSNIAIAVGLKSLAVALHVALAFKIGRMLDPHPHPISAIC